jgi:hypothetical protein
MSRPLSLRPVIAFALAVASPVGATPDGAKPAANAFGDDEAAPESDDGGDEDDDGLADHMDALAPGAAGLDDTDFGAPVSDGAPPLVHERAPVPVSIVHVGGQGTRVSFADDTLAFHFAGRLQSRLTADLPATALVPSRLNQPTRIEIARARLFFAASALNERMRFDLRLDPAAGVPSVLDASVMITAVRPWLAVQVGQNRTFFSRQYSTRAGDMQFGERPITTSAFDPERDIGVLVQSGTARTPFMVTAGAFQGNGRVVDSILDRGFDAARGAHPYDRRDVPLAGAVLGRPLFVARLMGGYGRANPYVENDLDGGPLRVSLGAGVLARANADAIAFDETAVTLDAMLKMRGVSVSGAVFSSALRDDGPLAVAPSQTGFHVQGGYVMKGLVEPVARYAVVSSGLEGALQQEALVGVNVFVLGGHMRWQTDVGVLHNAPELRLDARDVSTRLRTQLDVNF